MPHNHLEASASATAGAAGLLTAMSIAGAQIIHSAGDIPPITWQSHVLAAGIGAIGGMVYVFLARRSGMNVGLKDFADRLVAVAVSAFMAGIMAPGLAVIAQVEFPAIQALPANGIIPISFLVGAIGPLILGLLIAAIFMIKTNPKAVLEFFGGFLKAWRNK